MGCSCKLPVKIVIIDGIEVGLTGLRVSIEKVAELHLKDTDDIKKNLLTRIKFFGNYVPKEKEESYKDVLLSEYMKFVEMTK